MPPRGVRGKTLRNFAIGGPRSKIISPGQTTRLTVTLRPGRYTYRCTIDSHAMLGMKGVFRVTGRAVRRSRVRRHGPDVQVRRPAS